MLSPRSENTRNFCDLFDLSRSADNQLQALVTNTDLLRSGVRTTELSPLALGQIRSLVSLSDQVAENEYRRKILKEVFIDKMESRFDEIEAAHAETFSWLVDTKSTEPLTTQEEAIARQKLTDWLLHGSGIFHISGKPGSGKSTLMKLLCECPMTAGHLKARAGGETLVLASFFFWALGTKLQRSMNGLMRSLIHATLLQTPDLTATLFPTQWNLARENKSINITDQDIEVAFDTLTSTENRSSGHKFAFFIDGLDEYEGDPEPMLQKLFQWTRSNPSNIKICVSSRELLIFQERFARCEKLQIHKITQRDIKAYVNARLADNEDFRSYQDQGRVLRIADKIVDKADGVFLWVKVVVQGLLEGLLAEDRLEDLERKVNEIPRELESLYQAIFDKMLDQRFPTDRVRAMRSLFVMVAHHCHPEARPLLLLHYSFLDEYEEANFAFKMNDQDILKSTIEERLRRARKQLYRKCIGLLESVSTDDCDFMALGDTYPYHQKVRFIHRSVFEFLSQQRVHSLMIEGCGQFDAYDFNLQCFAATLRMFPPQKEYLNSFSHNLQMLLFDNVVWNNGNLTSRFLSDVIDYLDRSGLRITVQILPKNRQRNLERSPSEAVALIAAMVGITTVTVPTNRGITKSYPIATLLGLLPPDQVEMLAASTTNLLSATLITEQQTRKILMNNLMSGMRHIFKDGTSPNACLQHDDFPIWMHLMSAFAEDTRDCFLEPVVRLFLLYGVDAELSLRLTPVPKTTHFYQYKMALELATQGIRFPLKYLAVSTTHEPMASVIRFARRHNWKVPLRDWVQLFAPPERVHTLQMLIDHNIERHRLPTDTEVLELQSDEHHDLDFYRGVTFELHSPIVSRTMGLPDRPRHI